LQQAAEQPTHLPSSCEQPRASQTQSSQTQTLQQEQGAAALGADSLPPKPANKKDETAATLARTEPAKILVNIEKSPIEMNS
jgi:hypothetical protein